MDPVAAWARWCPSPSLGAMRLAERAIGRSDGLGAWPFVEGRVFGVCACNAGHGAQLGDVVATAREVWLLVAVALAVGEA